MTFLPFLPRDDAGIKDTATDCCVQLISADLGCLLRQDAKSFWSTVLNDPSLHVCIDSYLRFKRRGHDGRLDNIDGTSAVEQQLARRVFMVLMRMVSSAECGKGAPPDAERARCLYDRWLLDVPKLLDVAALYGPTNPGLVGQLLRNVFELQPQYTGDVQALVPLLADNLSGVQQQAVTSARAAARGDDAALASLCDAGAYMLDVCATLGSFVACYAPGARLLLSPGPGLLLGALTEVHDQLLPLLLHHIRRSPSAAPAATSSPSAHEQQQRQQLWSQLSQLGPVLQRLAFKLVVEAYLRAHASAPGAAGPSGSSGTHLKAAEERGNELMAVIMSVAASDMFEGGGARAGGSSGSGSAALDPQLLRDMQQRFRLDAEVVGAMHQGALALDDTQLDYLLALLGSSRSSAEAALQATTSAAAAGPSSSSSSQAPTSTSATCRAGASSSSAAGCSAGPCTSAAALLHPEASAKVAQIKEVMGDTYGDGYLHACLHAYSWEAEQVLHHILEGSLKPELQALDTSMRAWSPPVAVADGAMSWSGLAAGAADLSRQRGEAAAAHAARVVPQAAQAPSKRSQMHRGVARILERVDEEARSTTKALAGELQWEYDDEYDDSFDDLLRTGPDGLADAEGDEAVEQPGAKGPSQKQGFRGGYEDEPDDSFFRPGASGRDVAGPRPAVPRGLVPPDAAAAAAAALNPRQLQQPQQQSRGAPLFAGGAGRAPAPGVPGRGGAAAQGSRGGRGLQPRGKLWVLDGRIYNYPKPGAQEVGSQAEANQVLQAGLEAAKEIHGLGPGGNKPQSAPRWALPQQPPVSSREAPQQQLKDQQEGLEDEGSSRQRGGGGRGGRTTNYARKEAHKASVANHHRKDRAFKKMGMF